MTKTRISAADLIAKLNSDPQFVARREKEKQEAEARQAELLRAEAPLVRALEASGYPVASVWDLVNTAAPYTNAIPILLTHLARPYPPAVREGIARALAVPDAKSGWTVLTTMYRNENDARVKDGLAVAIAAAADAETISEVIDLARDNRHGPSRLLLLSALERSMDPRSRAALKALATDPELAKEIRIIQRRLRSTQR